MTKLVGLKAKTYSYLTEVKIKKERAQKSVS